MTDRSEEGADQRRVERRTLIKAAAAGGALAWTAPVILDSLTSPAAALSHCPAGSYYVAYTSTLTELFPNVTASGCAGPTGANVHPSAVGLVASFTGSCTGSLGSIAHIATSNGNCQPVTLNAGGCTNCKITSVQAHVHLRAAGTCPTGYCYPPSTATNAPLRLIGGGLGTSTVTIAPNYNDGAVCSGAAGIHWGSPNAPNGYLLVQVTCT